MYIKQWLTDTNKWRTIDSRIIRFAIRDIRSQKITLTIFATFRSCMFLEQVWSMVNTSHTFEVNVTLFACHLTIAWQLYPSKCAINSRRVSFTFYCVHLKKEASNWKIFIFFNTSFFVGTALWIVYGQSFSFPRSFVELRNNKLETGRPIILNKKHECCKAKLILCCGFIKKKKKIIPVYLDSVGT